MPKYEIQPLTPELRKKLEAQQKELAGLSENTPEFNKLLVEFTDILMTLSIEDYMRFQNRTK